MSAGMIAGQTMWALGHGWRKVGGRMHAWCGRLASRSQEDLVGHTTPTPHPRSPVHCARCLSRTRKEMG